MVATSRSEIISKLQQEILGLQGFNSRISSESGISLGPVQSAFPNATFPLGAIHEFLFTTLEDIAATCGFITALLKPVMNKGGVIFWIGQRRLVFPPGLASFGIHPDQIVFINVSNEKHVGWCVEEALKCPALTAVIGEVSGISFTASRRLQLAVERSEVTGFILCSGARAASASASVARWRITHLPGHIEQELPGVGFSQWKVELLRIRNGRPGAWNIRFASDNFELANEKSAHIITSDIPVIQSIGTSKRAV